MEKGCCVHFYIIHRDWQKHGLGYLFLSFLRIGFLLPNRQASQTCPSPCCGMYVCIYGCMYLCMRPLGPHKSACMHMAAIYKMTSFSSNIFNDQNKCVSGYVFNTYMLMSTFGVCIILPATSWLTTLLSNSSGAIQPKS